LTGKKGAGYSTGTVSCYRPVFSGKQMRIARNEE
jgi:hypothetical protein